MRVMQLFATRTPLHRLGWESREIGRRYRLAHQPERKCAIVTQDDVVVIFRRWITVKGKRIYPRNGGVFRLEIPRDKYKP